MSIAEKFVSMEYGPAPEDPKEILTWLDRHGRRFAHFINGAVAGSGRGRILRDGRPFEWRAVGGGGARVGGRH